jgi:hypothetical protein
MHHWTARWRSNRWAIAACVGLGLLLTGCAGSPAPTITPAADSAPSATSPVHPDQERAVAAASQFVDQMFTDEYRRRARLEVSRTDNGWWLVAFLGINVPCINPPERAPIGPGICGRRLLVRPEEELAFEDFHVCVNPRDLTARSAGPGLTCSVAHR